MVERRLGALPDERIEAFGESAQMGASRSWALTRLAWHTKGAAAGTQLSVGALR